MANQIYEKGAVFIDGQLLSESTSVSISIDPQNQPIFTQQKGFAGVSPGATQTQISVESAVPVVGFEYDFTDALQSVKEVEITVFAHSKKTTCKGFLMKVDQKYGVNQAASVSFDFIGEPVSETSL